jgi:hypothetical protein
MRKIIIIAYMAAHLLILTHIIAAADEKSGEQIKWQVLSGGGVKVTSTNYKLDGTVGQTAVGKGTSTNYNLFHGYWQNFESASCCNLPGDANNSGAINALDVTFLINYLYKGGAVPPCAPEGDINGNGVINALDVTYLINYLYKGGASPKCL